MLILLANVFKIYIKNSCQYVFVKMSKMLYSICIMSITSYICIHNTQNSADKSQKTYVIQLRTQSSIGHKKKKQLVMKNVINYISV